MGKGINLNIVSDIYECQKTSKKITLEDTENTNTADIETTLKTKIKIIKQPHFIHIGDEICIGDRRAIIIRLSNYEYLQWVTVQLN